MYNQFTEFQTQNFAIHLCTI